MQARIVGAALSLIQDKQNRSSIKLNPNDRWFLYLSTRKRVNGKFVEFTLRRKKIYFIVGMR